jgi:hypothetical protein
MRRGGAAVFVVMALGMIWMATVGCYDDRTS